MVKLEKIGTPSTKVDDLKARYDQLAEEIDKKEAELIKLNVKLLALLRATSFKEEMEKK